MSSVIFEAIHANLLSPPILFFALGIFATLVKSDLKFPEALYSAMTIYLLVAIGFKGGASIAEAGIGNVWLSVLAAAFIGTVIPIWTYPVLRFLGRFKQSDAAAIAAHYGSVSAVTFTVAQNFLDSTDQSYEGYATAFLAVMESPAIIMGILIGKWGCSHGKTQSETVMDSFKGTLHDAVFGRSVLLLVGSLLIGWICGAKGMDATAGFFVTPFQGILALFLLELGMVTARRLKELLRVGPFLLAFGVFMPVIHGMLGVWLGLFIDLSVGGSLLMGILAGSASYIAAPAAIRMALPEANPTFYLTASLAITFPFNVTIGIPLLFAFAQWLSGGA